AQAIEIRHALVERPNRQCNQVGGDRLGRLEGNGLFAVRRLLTDDGRDNRRIADDRYTGRCGNGYSKRRLEFGFVETRERVARHLSFELCKYVPIVLGFDAVDRVGNFVESPREFEV